MKDTFRVCRKCGKPIAVIEWGIYRKTIVDAEAVRVVPAEDGEDFVRIDGSKIRGRKADIEENAEIAYRMHRKSCGVEA